MRTDGPAVADWIEKKIVQTKGQWAGKSLALEAWERDFLDELFTLDSKGRRIYQEALLGLPKKNGKSTLGAGIGLYMLAADGEASPEVYGAAGSRDHAKVVFNQAKAMAEDSPKLADYLRPMQYHIACPSNHGIFRVLAADAKLQHGPSPSANIIDELWAHASADLYTALTSATGAREEPLTVTITTAGFDRESALGQLYDRALELKLETREDGFLTIGRDRASGFLFWWWGPPEGANLEDPKVWKRCNPASWISAKFLRQQRTKPSVRLSEFQRFHLNMWAEAEDYWLEPGEWEKCSDPTAGIPRGSEVWVGVDAGQKKDSAAIVLVWPHEGRVVTEARIFVPPEEGLRLAALEEAIRQVAGEYEVREVAYDPWRFMRSAEILEDEGLYMIEFPQTNERMCPATERLESAIKEQRIVHAGAQDFSAHIRAAAVVDTERGHRLKKAKARRPMDAAIALCMALARMDSGGPEPFVEVV